VTLRLTYDLFTLEKIVRLDAAGDGPITHEELRRAAPAIQQFLRDPVSLELNGVKVDLGAAGEPGWPSGKGEVIEEAELPKLRLTFDEGPAIETLTMHYCGEQRLAHWYTAFSANAPEPVLRQIFKVLAADELRHGAAYAKYLRKAVRNKPEVLPAILRMALWMIRTTNDNPKHPTTITEPSVVSLLEDPHYIRRMLNMYLPGRDHEAPVQRRILALMSELSGTKLTTVRDLLSHIRVVEGTAAAVAV